MDARALLLKCEKYAVNASFTGYGYNVSLFHQASTHFMHLRKEGQTFPDASADAGSPRHPPGRGEGPATQKMSTPRQDPQGKFMVKSRSPRQVDTESSPGNYRALKLLSPLFRTGGLNDPVQEARNTPFCPSQGKSHTVVLRGLGNISEAP